MRLYEVRPGDSPASIAATYAGCPKCSRDLIAANAHKAAVTHPNGYRSFREMSVGERLVLPEKWFDGSLDGLPPSYFASLPHPNGTTHGVGTLGDAASDAVAALGQLDNRTFSTAVWPAAALIDQSLSSADNSSNPGIKAYASATHISTNSAKQHNQDLIKALDAGDQAAASQARLAAQNDLLTAIQTAGMTLQADPGSVVVDIGQATIDPSFQIAAQAAATAIAADPNFCANVAQAGSTVNAAVHAFKTAWNAANPGNPVPINTGTYDQATAAVLTQVLGSAPAACASRAAPSPIPLPGITPPQPQVQTQPSSGIGLGGILGLSALGAGAVGGAIYYVTRKKPRARVRRVSA